MDEIQFQNKTKKMEGRGETAIWIFCLTDSTLLPPFQRIIYTWMATVRCNCMLSPNMLEFQAVEFFLHSWYFWPNFLLLEYEKVQNPCLKDSTFSGYLFRSELWWISLSGRKARPWVIKTCVKRSFFQEWPFSMSIEAPYRWPAKYQLTK